MSVRRFTKSRLVECSSCGGLRRSGGDSCPHCDLRFRTVRRTVSSIAAAAGLGIAATACGTLPPGSGASDSGIEAMDAEGGVDAGQDGGLEVADAYGIVDAGRDGGLELADAYGIADAGHDGGLEVADAYGIADAGHDGGVEAADAYGIVDAGQEEMADAGDHDGGQG